MLNATTPQDRVNTTDKVFMQELFIQQLPSNVCMVLASTPDTGNLEDLAQLADKMMEVAMLSVSGVKSTTEFAQLWQDVTNLKMLIQMLQQPR